MADDIKNAFCEATIDTFDALRKAPRLDDPKVVKELDTAYGYLQSVTGAPAQVLFDNISRGAHDVILASDHVMLVSGTEPRALTCDTCGKLVSHHGPADSYAVLLSAVQDIEAISLLEATVASLSE